MKRYSIIAVMSLLMVSCKDIINADGTHERWTNGSIAISIAVTLAVLGLIVYLIRKYN